ncbi:MAG TPA: 2,3-bisphosphoglycerate-independent phosphoglycerate mutase [Candidatus Dormibacteraeota bacterium]
MTGDGPLVLVIIDGWGCNDDPFGNAIAAARTPNLDRLQARWPATRLAASGEAVGLPPGQQGNSEVGHLTIGAGRVIFQDLPRISRDIGSGAFFENPVLVAAVERARARSATLHCVGLVSPGGVHSHQDHGVALAELARRRGLDRIAFHVITDGRDEPPRSAAEQVAGFATALARSRVARIATVSGRYWAMDRDQRWDRTQRAYEVLTGSGGLVVADAVDAIREAYTRGVSDEFIEPVAVVPPGAERITIGDGDTVVFFNFRPDRARQLSHALVDERFTGFPRRRLEGLELVTFTEYEVGLTPHVAFPKATVEHCLAEVVAERGLRQFHVAETEKYAHVTYFLNGGREVPFAGEERLLIPSPRVATYDLTPAMSAGPITDAVVARVHAGSDALIAVNYANPDMVGHTGEFAPTVTAVECVDACIGQVAEAVLAASGALMVTADHGNAELKIERSDNSRLTAHTTSPVPLLVIGAGAAPLSDGAGLRDVAPTALGILGIPAPAEMTGRDLRA